MRGQGESGRHAPGAREARGEDEESGGSFGEVRYPLPSPERAYTRYIREYYSRVRVGEKGKDRRRR